MLPYYVLAAGCAIICVLIVIMLRYNKKPAATNIAPAALGINRNRVKTLDEVYSDLLRALRSTAGARFRAAERLADHDRKLTRLTAFTSAYIIVLTIFPYFFDLHRETADVINIFTVFVSVVVLISSLLQYSSNDVVNAEQHHRSALEINESRRMLEAKASPAITQALLIEASEDFNVILQKYSINHIESDFKLWAISYPDEYPWYRDERRNIIWSARIARHIPNLVLSIVTLMTLYVTAVYAFPNRIPREDLVPKAQAASGIKSGTDFPITPEDGKKGSQ